MNIINMRINILINRKNLINLIILMIRKIQINIKILINLINKIVSNISFHKNMMMYNKIIMKLNNRRRGKICYNINNKNNFPII